MPQIQEQNLKSHETITSIGRQGAKTSNYPDHKVGSYGDAKMSHELTHQNDMGTAKNNSGGSSY